MPTHFHITWKQDIKLRRNFSALSAGTSNSTEISAIPGDQQNRRYRSDQIGMAEPDEFGNRKQEQIKQTKCRPDHQILERMNLLACRNFEEKESREHQNKKEYTVFDRALDVTI